MPSSRLLAFVLALFPYSYLVARFNFLADDAFIAFRYSRNLAAGLGLRYNPGVEPPVEGYSQFLWVVWLALFEKLGMDTTFWCRLTLIVCALILLWAILGFTARRISHSTTVLCATGLFFGTFSPIAAWSTGGMETMLFTLLVFLAYDQLLGEPERPRGVTAGWLLILVMLTRADGPYFIGLLLGCAYVTSVRTRSRALKRATLTAAGLAAAALMAYVAWRYSYYGDLLPNTAHVKVGMSLLSFERGTKYWIEFLLTYPFVGIVLATAAVRFVRFSNEVLLHAIIMFVGTCLYATIVGGDWMPMRRFLLPTVPFVMLAFADCLGAWTRGQTSRSLLTLAAVVIVVGANCTAAFNLYAVPRSVRARFHYNWSAPYLSEYEWWEMVKQIDHRWTLTGKALKLHTRPGESLVRRAIGAVGYYSDLFIHDRYGLVTREVAQRHVPPRRTTAGHAKLVEADFFLKHEPTYLFAEMMAHPRTPMKDRVIAPGPHYEGYEEVFLPLDPANGFPPNQGLLLIRRKGVPR